MNNVPNFISYGMLWLLPDDYIKDKAKAVHDAIQYYIKKYGKVPNVVYTNPTFLPVTVSDIELITTQYMLPRTILIGEK